jgi:hypothetical protein
MVSFPVRCAARLRGTSSRFRQLRSRSGRRAGPIDEAPRPSVNDVQIFDDFFPRATQEAILQLMERPKWSFTGGRPPNQFWHMDGLEEESFFREQLFSRICDKLGQSFGIERIYANGQTALQYGAPHRDDGDVTFLYYPNPVWKYSWNGPLMFVHNNEVETIVQYKPNRALLFPASLVHYADAPSKSFTGLRVSLAYKLRLPR